MEKRVDTINSFWWTCTDKEGNTMHFPSLSASPLCMTALIPVQYISVISTWIKLKSCSRGAHAFWKILVSWHFNRLTIHSIIVANQDSRTVSAFEKIIILFNKKSVSSYTCFIMTEIVNRKFCGIKIKNIINSFDITNCYFKVMPRKATYF